MAERYAAGNMRNGVKKMREELLRVEDLKIYYPVKAKFGQVRKSYVKAVDGITFTVFSGETFGIVGESGCGKSTTGFAIARLLNPISGKIFFKGRDLTKYSRAESKELAKKIQIIFQDPYSSLDPRYTIGKSIMEPLDVHHIGTKKDREDKVLNLLADVGLSAEQVTKYPHEFSGGQRQRVGTARALALNPDLVICDEPVSALDVSIQAQILNLMQKLQRQYNLTYVFISHNLSVVNHICDRLAVMYLGHIVEIADKKSLFNDPAHPYTQALLDAIPIPNPERKSMNRMLGGEVPSPINPPSGCCFHTRCEYAQEICTKCVPPVVKVGEEHSVACHFPKIN